MDSAITANETRAGTRPTSETCAAFVGKKKISAEAATFPCAATPSCFMFMLTIRVRVSFKEY